MNTLNYILFSKNNLILGEKLRKVIKKLNSDINYFNDITQAVNFLTSTKNNVVFVEKCFSKYVKVLTGFVSSNIFSNTALVFIDNGKELQRYVNNKNVYAVSEELAEDEIFEMVGKFSFILDSESVVDMSQVKVILSKILIEAGLSVKHVGFGYIKNCVEYLAKKHFRLTGLHGDVYKYVACLNNTNECNVERSIRNCITQAKKKDGSSINKLSKDFNYEITNKTFLGYIIEKIQEEYANVS